MAIEQQPSISLFEPPAEESFSQPTLLEVDQPEEIILDNCLVTSRPVIKKKGNTTQWHCSMYAPADIFHQDRDELIEVHTTTHTEMAQSKRVKPGDRVTLTGIVQQQEMELGSGEKKIVNHLFVSHIQVISRAKRVSITVYEQGKKR